MPVSSSMPVVQSLNEAVSVMINNGERPDPIWEIVHANGEPVQKKQYEMTWHDQTLRANYCNLVTAIAAADTTTLVVDNLGLTLFGVNGAVGDELVTVLSVITPSGAQEQMICTAGIPSTSLTVVRGQFGSTALAAIPAGSRIFADTNACQNALITKSVFQAPTEYKNYFQIFTSNPEVSRSVQQYDYPGDSNSMAGQSDFVLKALMRQYASALYNGIKFSGTTGGKPRYRMGGMWAFANNSAGPTTGALTLDKTFVENNVISTLQEVGADPMNLCLIVNRAQYPKITQLKRDLTINGGMKQEEMSINADLETYRYMGCRLTFGVSDNLSVNSAVAFDRSKVQMARITDDTFQIRDAGVDRDGDRKQIVGELSAQFHNPQSIRYFTNVT